MRKNVSDTTKQRWIPSAGACSRGDAGALRFDLIQSGERLATLSPQNFPAVADACTALHDLLEAAMRTLLDRAGFSQWAWRKSGKSIARAVLRASFAAWLIALVSVGIAGLAGMPLDSIPPVGAGHESKTESAPFYERAYFPARPSNQGAEASEICVSQS